MPTNKHKPAEAPTYFDPTVEEERAAMSVALMALAEVDGNVTLSFDLDGPGVGRLSPNHLQGVYEAVRYAVKFAPYEVQKPTEEPQRLGNNTWGINRTAYGRYDIQVDAEWNRVNAPPENPWDDNSVIVYLHNALKTEELQAQFRALMGRLQVGADLEHPEVAALLKSLQAGGLFDIELPATGPVW